MRARILLVEDEEMTRETIELLLTSNQYLVQSCPTGKNILETVADFSPNLIVLDILLGELDGRELCKELKANPVYRNIPIIVISGAPDIYNSIASSGANDIVLKPFEERTLMNRIERQLANSRQPYIFDRN